MPYTMETAPDYIKNLPEGAQRLFISVFNSTLEESNDEEKARMAGWGAVKNQYDQTDDGWVRKATEQFKYVAPMPMLFDEANPEEPVSRVQVLRTGTFFHRLYGKFTITPVTLKTMAENFKLKRPKAPTEMVVDYEHMSATEPAQVAPAAGWVRSLELDNNDNELYAFVGWTPKATEMIKNKEYRFISPEFVTHYHDKETNQDVGPTLLAMALTNRPFMEGMHPVVLVEELESVIMLSEGAATDVAATLAEWDTNYINNLPDSAFAFIRPGGEEDADGRTVPRSLRFLPYKSRNGEIDLPHLRNALSRLSQTSLTPEEQAQARTVLTKAARAEDVGEAAEENGKKQTEGGYRMDEQQIREALGIGEDADIMEAISALKAKAAQAEEAQGEVETMKAKELDQQAQAAIDKAIADKRLLPKQAPQAKAMYLKDADAFAAFLAEAPEVGPETNERGTETDHNDNPNNPVGTITATEHTIAARLGLTDKQYLEQKERDANKANAMRLAEQQ